MKIITTRLATTTLLLAIALPASADQVIGDDLIVDGSACIGQDCVNGESFGFDTIRIKENNLRIRTVDTSSAGSFPTSDWQITFNDSSNGGQNKFSIEHIDSGRTPFTIEAYARTHALYVDDAGRIGFGTATPVVQLHVKDGNTPTLRLEQDGTSGFTPQTWDLAGNEANFFIRDATNGSTLPFRVFPAAPSNALTIEASTGDIGMGTTSPDAALDIESTAAALRLTNPTSGTGNTWEFQSKFDSGRLNIVNVTNSNAPVKIDDLAANNLLKLGLDGAPDEVHITGKLFINSIDNSNPDYVFESEYELQSIDEHAAYMWENKHLPAVGAGVNGKSGKARIDVAGRSQGVLEELEKAHIYIEQLHERLSDKEAKLDVFAERLERLEGQLIASDQ